MSSQRTSYTLTTRALTVQQLTFLSPHHCNNNKDKPKNAWHWRSAYPPVHRVEWALPAKHNAYTESIAPRHKTCSKTDESSSLAQSINSRWMQSSSFIFSVLPFLQVDCDVHKMLLVKLGRGAEGPPSPAWLASYGGSVQYIHHGPDWSRVSVGKLPAQPCCVAHSCCSLLTASPVILRCSSINQLHLCHVYLLSQSL